MQLVITALRVTLLIGLVCACLAFIGKQTNSTYSQSTAPVADFQYRFANIAIPKASEAEPLLDNFSLQRGLSYLDQANAAWNGGRRCITCHTNGSYMTTRPALTDKVGQPPKEARQFFVAALKDLMVQPREKYTKGIAATQVIYVAAGLAEWDAHVTKRLSTETVQGMALMFEIQREDGAWARPSTCWPPFESDSYHGATLAAMAIATAPGWLKGEDGRRLQSKVKLLQHYLRTETPPHDYSRLWLLRAASRMPGLLSKSEKRELLTMVLSHQRKDGGWSIRTFAHPEQWGIGTRAAKLRAEPTFEDPPSDGHQTGLAIVALREAGLPSRDPRIQRGVRWLLANQRVSGRWWTRSLNTDRWHYITLSGTGYALQALDLADSLPRNVAVQKGGAGQGR